MGFVWGWYGFSKDFVRRLIWVCVGCGMGLVWVLCEVCYGVCGGF